MTLSSSLSETLLPELQSLMRTYHFRPAKSLGQNFLIDETAISALVTAGHLSKKDRVMEIGGGTGFITRELVKKAQSVTTLETDPVMVELLQKEISSPILNVLHQNAFDPKTPWPSFDKIVSAPPYHYSSLLVEKLYHHDLAGGSLLLQEEFATKLTSFPGFRDYTAISVIAQLRFSLEIVKTIPRGSFYPVPQSDSAILALTQSFPFGKPLSRDDVAFLVKELFRYKNKDLAKSIRHSQKPLEKRFNIPISDFLARLPSDWLDQKVFQMGPESFLTIEKAIRA